MPSSKDEKKDWTTPLWDTLVDPSSAATGRGASSPGSGVYYNRTSFSSPPPSGSNHGVSPSAESALETASQACARGRAAWTAGQLHQSLAEFQSAVSILQSILTARHALTAKTYYWIGFLNKHQHKYGPAIQAFQTTLYLRCQLFGSNDDSSREAQTALKWVLQQQQPSHEVDIPAYLIAVVHAAKAHLKAEKYQQQGLLEKALDAYQKSLFLLAPLRGTLPQDLCGLHLHVGYLHASLQHFEHASVSYWKAWKLVRVNTQRKDEGIMSGPEQIPLNLLVGALASSSSSGSINRRTSLKQSQELSNALEAAMNAHLNNSQDNGSEDPAIALLLRLKIVQDRQHALILYLGGLEEDYKESSAIPSSPSSSRRLTSMSADSASTHSSSSRLVDFQSANRQLQSLQHPPQSPPPTRRTLVREEGTVNPNSNGSSSSAVHSLEVQVTHLEERLRSQSDELLKQKHLVSQWESKYQQQDVRSKQYKDELEQSREQLAAVSRQVGALQDQCAMFKRRAQQQESEWQDRLQKEEQRGREALLSANLEHTKETEKQLLQQAFKLESSWRQENEALSHTLEEVKVELEDSRAARSSLEEEIETTRQDNTRLDAEVARLERESSNTMEEVQGARDEMLRLEKIVAETKTALSEWKLKFQSEVDRSAELSRQVEQLQAIVDVGDPRELRGLLQQIEGEKQDLQAVVDRERAEKKSIASDLLERKHEIDRLNRMAEEERTTTESMRTDISQREREMKDMARNLDVAKNDIMKKESKVKELRSSLSAADEALAEVQRERDSLSQKTSSLEEEISSAQNEIRDLRSDLDLLKTTNQQLDVSLSDARTEIESIRVDRDAAATARSSLQKEVQELKRCLEQSESQLQEKESLRLQLEEALVTAKNDDETLCRTTESDTKARGELKRNLEAIARERQEIHNALEVERTTRAETSRKLDEATRDLRSMQEVVDARNLEKSTLETVLNELRETLLVKEKDLLQVREKLEDAMTDRSLQGEKIVRLETELAAIRCEADERALEQHTLKDKLDNMKSALDDSDDKAKQLQVMFDETLSEKEAILTQLNAHKESIPVEQQKKNSLQAENSALQLENSKLKEHELSIATLLKKADTKISSLEKELAEKDAELATLSKAALNGMQHVDNTSDSRKELDSENEELRDRVRKAESEVQLLQCEQTSAIMKIAELEMAQQNDMDDTPASKTQQQFETQLAELNDKLKAAELEIDEKTSQLLAKDSRIESLNAELSTTASKLESLNSEFDETKTEQGHRSLPSSPERSLISSPAGQHAWQAQQNRIAQLTEEVEELREQNESLTVMTFSPTNGNETSAAAAFKEKERRAAKVLKDMSEQLVASNEQYSRVHKKYSKLKATALQLKQQNEELKRSSTSQHIVARQVDRSRGSIVSKKSPSSGPTPLDRIKEESTSSLTSLATRDRNATVLNSSDVAKALFGIVPCWFADSTGVVYNIRLPGASDSAVFETLGGSSPEDYNRCADPLIPSSLEVVCRLPSPKAVCLLVSKQSDVHIVTQSDTSPSGYDVQSETLDRMEEPFGWHRLENDEGYGDVASGDGCWISLDQVVEHALQVRENFCHTSSLAMTSMPRSQRNMRQRRDIYSLVLAVVNWMLVTELRCQRLAAWTLYGSPFPVGARAILTYQRSPWKPQLERLREKWIRRFGRHDSLFVTLFVLFAALLTKKIIVLL